MKKDIYKEKVYDLIEVIDTFYQQFIDNAENGYLNGNKTAMKRARVNTMQLTRLFKEFRKITIEDEKRSKESK